VLDRSKLEEGKVQLELTEFDLHDLLADSLEGFTTIATGKGIDLILDIHPEVPRRTIGDPFRLRQILANLVSNALKFTKEVGEGGISLYCSRRRSRLLLDAI